ncbi:hypothetical protein BDU57DRAFT_527361 [Ampelomyces quisqualis]|uniref:Uncharacterized protein n=1 Tax=Ampelomyces quisqualis TaxID=50730 RepID=A0A6A5QVC5_AMPQU|nr:hypothetical protein BDU57DRAFT_527361 [Ampelomyces quisqualis]
MASGHILKCTSDENGKKSLSLGRSNQNAADTVLTSCTVERQDNRVAGISYPAEDMTAIEVPEAHDRGFVGATPFLSSLSTRLRESFTFLSGDRQTIGISDISDPRWSCVAIARLLPYVLAHEQIAGSSLPFLVSSTSVQGGRIRAAGIERLPVPSVRSGQLGSG